MGLGEEGVEIFSGEELGGEGGDGDALVLVVA